MSVQGLKFCKDCVFYRNDKPEVSAPYCDHPNNADPVSGVIHPVGMYRLCIDIRKNRVGMCGMDGSWFELPASVFVPKNKETE